MTQPSTPDEIRAEIDQTRADLGAAVDQLADKLNVKAQAGAKLDDLKSSATNAASRVKAADPGQRNKIIAAGAAAVLLVLGLALRRRRR